jgi:hypothetical protein
MRTHLKSQKNSAFYINSLFSIALFLSLFLSFNACKEKEDDPVEQVSLVESIDIKEMAKIHLKDFSFLRERFFYGLDTQYVYTSNNNEVIDIVLGIYPSQAAADSSLNKYFSEMVGLPIKGSYQGIEVGDSFWWLTGPINQVSNVWFIRRNAMFMMSSIRYDGLVDLAKKIDDDILTEASYVKFKN